jgi:hypothetical protein
MTGGRVASTPLRLMVVLVALKWGHTIQRADLAVAGIHERDMRRLWHKQPGIAFGNQQQSDVVCRQQRLIHLAGEIVGEGHRYGAQFDQRQVVHQPRIRVGRIDAHTHAPLYAPVGQVATHAHDIIEKAGMGMTDGIAAFVNVDCAFPGGQAGDQTAKLHSSLSFFLARSRDRTYATYFTQPQSS